VGTAGRRWVDKMARRKGGKVKKSPQFCKEGRGAPVRFMIVPFGGFNRKRATSKEQKKRRFWGLGVVGGG